MKDKLINALQKSLKSDATIFDVAPNRIQISAPFYHADGDPMEIYAYITDSTDTVTLTDCGMSLMRLSYTENITDSTINKIKKLINQYRFNFVDGEIMIEAPIKSISSYLSNFALTISKVMGLSELSKNKVTSDFKQHINDFIMDSLSAYKPQADFILDERDRVTVDYKLTPPTNNNLQLFIFPVNNSNKATEVWGTLQFCLNAQIKFRSIVACEDFNNLNQVSQKRMVNNSDSFLMTESDFYDNANTKLQRLSTTN